MKIWLNQTFAAPSHSSGLEDTFDDASRSCRECNCIGDDDCRNCGCDCGDGECRGDRNRLYGEHSNDWQCECKHMCAVPPPLKGELTERSILVHAAPLHIQECAEDRWLVCNPTATARIVVLDGEALTLLQQFATARAATDAFLPAIGAAWEDTFALVSLLYEQGILQDSVANSARSAEMADTPEETLAVWLHVTNVCNLRCHYCYLDKSSENMSEDTAFAAIDAIFRSAQQGHFKQVHLKYAGGEASLVMSRVCAIHDYARELAQRHEIVLSATLLSNGVIIAASAIKQLKERHIRVMISLDGIGEYHDRQRPFKQGQPSFKYVDKTIDKLLAYDLVPHISVTISRSNLAGLPALLRYILERNLHFSLNLYRDNDCVVHREDLQFEEAELIAGMRAAYHILEELLPQRSLLGSLVDKANLHAPHLHTCGVGRNYLVIDQHGGVAKCQADIKRTVTTIRAHDPLRVIQQDRSGIQNVSVQEKEGCRSCSWRYWCAGGCPLLTYRMTGRYDIKSPNCRIYKALFPEALRLEGLRLLKYSTPITFVPQVLPR
jgi:radical SAM additional 4Fe4S-binding domain